MTNKFNSRLLYASLIFLLIFFLIGWGFISSRVNLAAIVSPSGAVIAQLPAGFQAQVFMSGLKQPRFITFDSNGVLYVAERANNRIVSLPDTNHDGVADSVKVFAEDIETPHSLVQYKGAWYVGVPTGVIKLEDTNNDGIADKRTVLIDNYPTIVHNTRTVLFLPDGRMVVSIGSGCNVCDEIDPRRGGIVVYDNEKATGEKIFAHGLRNAVGLTLHPGTGELWATNNGRDLMGDDLPPDTVYIIKEGLNYGWPRCHSGTIIDPEMGAPDSCKGVEQPIIQMQAHSAPLGLTFYNGKNFPVEYQGSLFIALHGSWNRSVPTGYKVIRVPFKDGKPLPAQDFFSGFLDDKKGEASGRPVGLAVSPDGSLFVSDDKGGFIYRISYTPSK